MMISSLRRAGVALVVVAAVSIQAAASSNDSFAAALGDIRAPLANAAKSKAKPQIPAAPKAPSAPDAVWQKVLEAVRNDGKYRPETDEMPGSFSLSEVAGDPKGDHIVREIAVLGMLNEDEQFQAMGAVFVVKSYKLDAKDGNWLIDQWLFQADIYGDVMNAGHGVVIQSPDGKTLSAVPDQLDPADPKIQAQYDAMLKHWAERKPEGA